MIPFKKPRLTPPPPPVEGAKWISLTRDVFALVDDADYELVKRYTWSALKTTRSYYAVRCYSIGGGKKRTELLHRVIMDAPAGMQVDHIDSDGLNCRRANMRVCTVKENHRNTRKPLSAKTSRFKGVYWMKQRNKWVAGIYYDNKRRTLGYFDEECAAARRYNEEATRVFGEFARLNTA